MFDGIFDGLFAIVQWQSIIAMIGGVIIGMVLGALPGLSATLGVALAIPFTYAMSPLAALGLLAGIHNGGSQGGAIPAILLRIPGTPGAICTAWDGYPLAQQGHAGAAINLAAVSSAVGGMISALSLVLLAPPLAQVSLAFGPPEIFWVNVFGLAAIAAMLGDDLLKGIIAACFGLLIATIGLDNVTGHERFTFGTLELVNGIPQLAVMVGMFSFPPAWELAEKIYVVGTGQFYQIKSGGGRIWKFGQVWWIWLKSSLIGIIIGILPGSAISAFIAYNEARRASREPEKFGKGSVEGLAAAESVNNADNAAAMIPTLTLGVPGSNIAALMLGALLIQGFQPGPQLFRDAPEIVYGYAWAMFITAALLIPLGGAVASRVFAHVLRLPALLLLPLIVVTAATGSFAAENSMFQVYLAGLFGLVGLFMIRFGFPIAPVIIGVVLGDKAEFNLRVSLLMSGGDWSILYSRPICLILIALTALLLFYPAVRYFRDLRRGGEDKARERGLSPEEMVQ
jgi:putative tricarboxylic transport membrane protein